MIEKPLSELAPTDPDGFAVHVRGTLMRIAIEGPRRGALMLLVPGVPGGHRDFRYLAPRLASLGFRAVRLELPGFGSNRHAPVHSDYSPEGRAKLIAATADALDTWRFSVLGHSMGGSGALATAALFPQRVERLVMVASTGLSPHRGLPAPPPVIRAIVGASRRSPLWPTFCSKVRSEYKRLRFADVDAISNEELFVHARCIGAQDFRASRRHAEQAVAPSLVAFADDDQMIEPAIGIETAATLLNGQALRFPTGGHALQKSRAAEIASAVAAMKARLG